MREFIGYMLLYTALAAGITVLFGDDLTWQEKLGIYSILRINSCRCVFYNRVGV